MLKSIKINNFKSVQDLDIELGRVNVFIGENGCGKTSILEAMALASAAVSNKLDQEFLVSRGVRVTDPKLMKSAFDKSQNNNDISISVFNADEKFLNYEINYKNKSIQADLVESNVKKLSDTIFDQFIDTLSNDTKFKSQLNRKWSNKALEKYFQDFLNERKDSISPNDLINITKPEALSGFNISNFLIYTPENFFLRRFEEEGQISPIGVRGEGLFKHLVDLFKEDPSFAKDLNKNLKLISWFDSLAIPSDLLFTESRINIKDKFLKETIDFFDQRSANEGFLFLLFYFTIFLSSDTPDFFAIDNIDNSLNPKLCKELVTRLIKLSKEKDKQVIFTTHNPSVLDGLDLTDDSQRLFVVYRNSEGHTKTKRVKPPKPIDGVNSVRLSEAFIRGYLGGLPKNF